MAEEQREPDPENIPEEERLREGEGMPKYPSKPIKKPSKLAITVQRVVAELRESYAVIGIELSHEKVSEMVKKGLEEIVHIYTVRELCDCVKLPHSYVGIAEAENDASVQSEESKKEDEDE